MASSLFYEIGFCRTMLFIKMVFWGSRGELKASRISALPFPFLSSIGKAMLKSH